MSKLFECVIADEVHSHSEYDSYQFGFKAGHSTGQCTNVSKNVVEYYTSRGSYVFTCFIDFTKAFDRVSYWKLFNKLLDDGSNSRVIAVLAYWYSHGKYACAGVIHYQMCLIFEMVLDRAVYYHLLKHLQDVGIVLGNCQ